MNTQSILNTIQLHADALRAYGVNKVGVFGSAVRGEMTDTSDIDLLVDFDEGKKTFHNFMDTAFLLEKTFRKKIDLVTPQGLSPYIKPYIDKEIQYVQINR